MDEVENIDGVDLVSDKLQLLVFMHIITYVVLRMPNAYAESPINNHHIWHLQF